MIRTVSYLAALVAAFGLVAVDGSALAQGKGKDKDRQEKSQKAKHVHHNGKDLLGDKIKVNGKHKLHENGKHTAYVNVANGKITGVSVVHADKGPVPVKKYKTTKKMAEAPASGLQTVAFNLAQQGTQYLGQTWIGYAYYDDWGNEVIYWFPYDMIYDGDTGAVEYIPAY
jgi:hypothetical protein